MRNLVIIRGGPNSLHNYWVGKSKKCNFDVFVCPYQDLTETVRKEGLNVGKVIAGPKWIGLRTLLNEWNDWKFYEYVMLADDDLLMSEHHIEKFFENCRQFDAKIAQPSLATYSPASHLITFQNDSFVCRQTTFVEIMAPTFKSDVLKEFLWTLNITESGWGWGLDHLWPKLLDYQGVYISDNTPMVHTLPVGRARDANLLAKVISEMRDIHAKYQCNPNFQSLSGVLHTGNTLDYSDPIFLYSLIEGYKRLFLEQPGLLFGFIQQQMLTEPPSSYPMANEEIRKRLWSNGWQIKNN